MLSWHMINSRIYLGYLFRLSEGDQKVINSIPTYCNVMLPWAPDVKNLKTKGYASVGY